jgi:hypothetical protein
METKSEGPYELLTSVICADGYHLSILPTQEKKSPGNSKSESGQGIDKITLPD